MSSTISIFSPTYGVGTLLSFKVGADSLTDFVGSTTEGVFCHIVLPVLLRLPNHPPVTIFSDQCRVKFAEPTDRLTLLHQLEQGLLEHRKMNPTFWLDLSFRVESE